MNSRDAAYEQSIQELLEATAAEGAAAVNGEATNKDRAESVTTKTEEVYEEIIEIGPGGRKKRKRAEPTPRNAFPHVVEKVHGANSLLTDC